MKKSLASVIVASVLVGAVVSCNVSKPTSAADKAFSAVRLVLETNCVHCHGDNRLSTMPSINDTHALAKLVAQGTWIVPGKPEKSRLYQVVTFADNVPGAMPPTGHAISKKDIEILRGWIQSGAHLPTGNVTLKPRGGVPRSV